MKSNHFHCNICLKILKCDSTFTPLCVAFRQSPKLTWVKEIEEAEKGADYAKSIREADVHICNDCATELAIQFVRPDLRVSLGFAPLVGKPS